MKKKITLKQFIVNTLRRASYRWGPRNEAKKKAKIARNQYRCNKCKGIFTNSQVKVDHISPVVNPENGFENWEVYINRLFCDEFGYQVLCIQDHDEKTKIEREIRKQNKKK